jgi:hypothetical protein
MKCDIVPAAQKYTQQFYDLNFNLKPSIVILYSLESELAQALASIQQNESNSAERNATYLR